MKKIASMAAAACCAATAWGGATELAEMLAKPPDSARPWVYWYFMDGNTTQEGMEADLASMKESGIGGALFLEVGLGNPPRGPVEFLSPKWLELLGFAFREGGRLGLEMSIGTGPGWCGTGGKDVKPEDAMQHTVASETQLEGPASFSGVLPVPRPRNPFFGPWTLQGSLRKDWETFYRDELVIAFPTPEGKARLPHADEKALYLRAPYSSYPNVKPRLEPSTVQVPPEQCVDPDKVVVLTDKMDAQGRLSWHVPAGKWTVLRIGRRLTGQTTRPAPLPGLGFETDKFSRRAIERHLRSYGDKTAGMPGVRRADGKGLAMFHFDSWEMSAQNGSEEFLEEFEKRRGYSPVKWLPAITGRITGDTDKTERFLFDWRKTAQELVIENHLLALKEYAHSKGLGFSSEPYDMNPCCDMDSGAVADVPMCEFWSAGYSLPAEYSCFESTSIAHVTGRPIVGAEAFTADKEYWRQHPGSMKAQGEWAFCIGINRFVFHTWQHQPGMTDKPGMIMGGRYGVNWHRNQTWWPMVGAYHRYLTRCSALLRQGRPAGGIVYLLPDGAPNVFTPPKDAVLPGRFPDKRGTPFDGCSPALFVKNASFRDGEIAFAGGLRCRALVLPRTAAMSPELLRKIEEAAAAGVPVFGGTPHKSPSLENWPRCDEEADKTASRIEKLLAADAARFPECFKPADGGIYPSYAAVEKALAAKGMRPDFETPGDLRHIRRITDAGDLYFVGDRSGRPQTTKCRFATSAAAGAGGLRAEWWDPVSGERRRLEGRTVPAAGNGKSSAVFETELKLAAGESGFVVLFDPAKAAALPPAAPAAETAAVATLDAPWTVRFDPSWGGPQTNLSFKTLDDWSKRPEPGVRYYSGIATYSQIAELAPGERPDSISLGDVACLARVKVNGRDLGCVWCAPWRVKIPADVWKDGANLVEIEVANLWPNRLIGDAALPQEKRFTRTNANPYRKDTPLLRSGLMGPVRLERETPRAGGAGDGDVPFSAIRLRKPQTDSREIWEATLAQFAKYHEAVDDVWLSTGITFPPMEEHRAAAKRLGAAAAQLRRLGIKPSLQIQATIGHDDSLALYSDNSGAAWQKYVSADGATAKTLNCYRAPAFVAYMREMAAAYAEAVRPYSVWIDDDIRVINHGGPGFGCHCGRCLAEFAKKEGCAPMTRERLAEKAKSDAGLAARWRRFAFDGAAELALEIGKAVHAVSPETRMCQQQPGACFPEHRGLYQAHRDATGLGVGMRPGAGAYYDWDPRAQIGKAYYLALQIDTIGPPPFIDRICPEIESWPRTATCRTGQGVLLEALENLSQGMNSISALIIDATYETPEWYGRELLAPLARNAAMMKRYVALNEGAARTGYGTFGTPASQLQTSSLPLKPLIAGRKSLLARIVTAEDAKEAVDGGKDAVRALLGEDILLDGGAAEILAKAGHGAEIGVAECVKASAGLRERFLDVPLNAGLEARETPAVGTTFFLKPAAGAQAVSEYCSDAKRAGLDFPGCAALAFETKEGLRRVVFGQAAFTSGLSRASGGRLMQLHRLCDWASHGKSPVLVETPVRAFVQPRVRPDGSLASVMVVHASIGASGPVRLRLRGVAGNAAKAVWSALDAKDVVLDLERDGDGATVSIPSIGPWTGGYLCF